MRTYLKIILVITLNLVLSCSVRNINYDRQKIEKRYAAKYDIMIDSMMVKFKNTFVDRENIKSIKVNKREKIIEISQHKKRIFSELKNLKIDSLSSSLREISKNGLIVFNGIPISDLNNSKIILDPNSIKEFSILSKKHLDTTTTWYNHKGNLVLISTN